MRVQVKEVLDKVVPLTGPEIRKKPGIYMAQGIHKGIIIIVRESHLDDIFLIRNNSLAPCDGHKSGWFDTEITYLPYKKPLLVEFQPE
jgi:hypothetical protein